MVRWLVLALLIGSCAGCASGRADSIQNEQSSSSAPEPLKLAGSAEASRIGMFSDHGEVHVGDSWESARVAFPDPRGAYDLHDLPSDFPSEYNAHGWETPTGEGFGTITSDGKVVLAMYQLERTKEENVREFLKQQVDKLGTPDAQLSGRTLNYWFWSDPNAMQSLMLCELTTPAGINVTMAMGDDNVLDRLGISVAKAKKGATRIDGNPMLFMSRQKTEERNAAPNR